MLMVLQVTFVGRRRAGHFQAARLCELYDVMFFKRYEYHQTGTPSHQLCDHSPSDSTTGSCDVSSIAWPPHALGAGMTSLGLGKLGEAFA